MDTSKQERQPPFDILAHIADLRAARCAETRSGVAADMHAWFRRTIIERGMTQMDLAVQADLSPKTVFRLLHGSNPRLATIALAALAMGFTAEA